MESRPVGLHTHEGSALTTEQRRQEDAKRRVTES